MFKIKEWLRKVFRPTPVLQLPFHPAPETHLGIDRFIKELDDIHTDSAVLVVDVRFSHVKDLYQRSQDIQDRIDDLLDELDDYSLKENDKNPEFLTWCINYYVALNCSDDQLTQLSAIFNGYLNRIHVTNKTYFDPSFFTTIRAAIYYCKSKTTT